MMNFVGWLESLGITVNHGAELHDAPDTALVCIVQTNLWEHREHIADRNLQALCTALTQNADVALAAAVQQFAQQADKMDDAELDKFWRYLDLFVLLVE